MTDEERQRIDQRQLTVELKLFVLRVFWLTLLKGRDFLAAKAAAEAAADACEAKKYYSDRDLSEEVDDWVDGAIVDLAEIGMPKVWIDGPSTEDSP